MERESFTIVNENEHDITGEIRRPKKAGKFPCAVFSHGLLDTKESLWIKTLAKKFLDDGWAAVQFDYTNAFGESGGKAEDITISQWARDLSRVVQYAKRRSYIGDSVVVIGHCYGAMAALAMEGFNHILAGLVLLSTPARIEHTRLTRKSEHEMTRIKLKRYFHIHHEDMHRDVRLNYSFFEDGMKLDMDRAARNLRTPTLFIHGEEDESIPPENSKRMFERAVGPKELLLIPKAGHELKGAVLTKAYAAIQEFLAANKIRQQ